MLTASSFASLVPISGVDHRRCKYVCNMYMLDQKYAVTRVYNSYTIDPMMYNKVHLFIIIIRYIDIKTYNDYFVL
jgi:hypothetical protein